MIEGLSQLTRRAQINIEFFDDVDRQTNRASLIHQTAFDRLTNPPGGIGREAEPTLGIELFNGSNQAQIALFHQIQ